MRVLRRTFQTIHQCAVRVDSDDLLPQFTQWLADRAQVMTVKRGERTRHVARRNHAVQFLKRPYQADGAVSLGHQSSCDLESIVPTVICRP